MGWGGEEGGEGRREERGRGGVVGVCELFSILKVGPTSLKSF